MPARRSSRGPLQSRPMRLRRRDAGRGAAAAAPGPPASASPSTGRRAGSTRPRPTPRPSRTDPGSPRSPGADAATTTARRPAATRAPRGGPVPAPARRTHRSRVAGRWAMPQAPPPGSGAHRRGGPRRRMRAQPGEIAGRRLVPARVVRVAAIHVDEEPRERTDVLVVVPDDVDESAPARRTAGSRGSVRDLPARDVAVPAHAQQLRLDRCAAARRSCGGGTPGARAAGGRDGRHGAAGPAPAIRNRATSSGQSKPRPL